ncbi:hypothetical protein PHLCEN_2v9899 [Hermanssonia centrifuga]|uniref:Uncharacterized protein n=1 Tax=Hermanssonia centrifuga TaxID=98765 RepID=A0A2R6NPI7_9APHY|nr:hypothetical protein PHLCEN_2v9899 [Hermanssonia centrifuga]
MLHRETPAISRTPTATLPAFDASIYQWKTSESQIYQEADISSVFGERGSVVSQPNDIAVHSLHNTVTLNDADFKPTPRALVRQFRARNSLENMDNPPPYRF